MKKSSWAASALAASLGWSAAFAAPVSTTVVVDGAVANPATYDYAALAARPSVTQTDTFVAGSVSQTHVYTGTTVAGLLDAAVVRTNPAIRNDILDKIVVVTATDGYKIVLSAGEINPSFGNRPDLLAYAETIGGTTAPIAGDGFARLTVPGDDKGGRYVSNVTQLQVQASAAKPGATAGGPSTSFTVSGAVLSTKTFDATSLAMLPVTTQTIGTTTYTGTSLWNLLATTVGIPVSGAVKNDILGKYVVATGSDGYQVVFSLGEIDPDFGDQPDFIAYLANGASLGAAGFARLVVPNDVRAGRWVSNLVSLEVFTAAAVPEPGTTVLLGAGLVAVGAVAARRRAASRTSASATR